MTDTALHIVTYVCVGFFVVSVVTRFIKLARLPMHVRWELYPVAHEKGRAHYGGSILEELDWWTKPKESSLVSEMKFMIPEIVLLAGVRHKNKSQWYRSFPFHFGLYLLIGTVGLLIVGGIAAAAGASGGLWKLLATVGTVTGFAGLGLGFLGSVALFLRRLLNEEYREYTAPADYLNLLFFIAALGIALFAHVTVDPDFSLARGFYAGLLTFGGHETAGSLPGIMAVQVVLFAVLMAYVPVTHMSHFFTKYFMYHDVRWSDEPMRAGSRLEKRAQEVLGLKPTWSAPHIRGDGKKTWVDVATAPCSPEEPEPKEGE